VYIFVAVYYYYYSAKVKKCVSIIALRTEQPPASVCEIEKKGEADL
jgi:hypothetical protein